MTLCFSDRMTGLSLSLSLYLSLSVWEAGGMNTRGNALEDGL